MGEKMHSNFKTENKESKELWRGSIGFDFIFMRDYKGMLEKVRDKDPYSKEITYEVFKKPICVEFNGSNSGIFGIQEIKNYDKTKKIVADIRGSRNKTLDQKMATYDEIANPEILGKKIDHKVIRHLGWDITSTDDLETQNKIRTALNTILKKEPLFPRAYQNPVLVSDVCKNKKLQSLYIPEENMPKRWEPGVYDKPSYGLWVLKPREGTHGKNIGIVSSRDFDAIMSGKKMSDIKRQKIILNRYIVEEFIPPTGADEVDEAHEGNPASMRLLLDFRVMENGEIKVDGEYAYQRVSPHKTSENVELEAKFVVNKAKGALAFPASKKEVELARPVALSIIKKLETTAILSKRVEVD